MSISEIAALRLPGLPTSTRGMLALAQRRGWFAAEAKGQNWRPRIGRGGGFDLRVSVLPHEVQVALAGRDAPVDAEGVAHSEQRRAALWEEFARLPVSRRAVAEARLKIVVQVQTLIEGGMRRVAAAHQVSVANKVALSSLYRWQQIVAGSDRTEWLPLLASRHQGSGRRAACATAAWDFFVADYLRPEKPTAESCRRRLLAVAAVEGWDVPSLATLKRRVEADIDAAVIVRRREGDDALKRMFPAQERDRSVFCALQAVNADGHKIDVFVRWPGLANATAIVRPMLLVFQDLYSGMILSWRADVSENKELVRLAYGDLVERWGVPDKAYLDNGRGFASKWITGGAERRNRFKVQAGEIGGVMTQLGTEPVFVTPYSGQSKPIERAFRDLADNVARDPRFAGAYVGNNPTAKPANYGSAAVPLDLFLRVVEEGIAEHNNRVGRDTRVCGRALSFRQAFDASYAQGSPRKASPEQRRLFLLPGELVLARRPEGSIHLHGNRFHAPFLWQQIGRRLQVRFDPQRLRDGVFVYTNDGRFLGDAPCIEAVGFDDITAAQSHARNRRAFMRATREADLAAAGMPIEHVQRLLDKSAQTEAPAPETKVVRLVSGNTVRQVAVRAEDPDEDARYEREMAKHDRFLNAIGAVYADRKLRIVGEED